MKIDKRELKYFVDLTKLSAQQAAAELFSPAASAYRKLRGQNRPAGPTPKP